MLTFHQLTINACDKPLLHSVSGHLKAGDKVALIGHSGSGKSVLLQALADLLPLDDGAIYFNGTALTDIAPVIYRSTVAFIAQKPALVQGTVLDNLRLPFGFLHHKGRVFDENWHKDKLAQLGKSATFLGQDVAHLSGGECQIVHMLRSLQFNPSILLLDEPTSALDPKTALALMDLVLDWHDEHKAFIWVTHTHDEIATLHAKTWTMTAGVLDA